MQKGVENFNEEALSDALLFRSLSKGKLAELCGVSAATITKYLSGLSCPSYTNFSKLCEALDFPANYFLCSAEHKVTAPKLWRSIANAHKKARKRAEIIIKWQVKIHEHYKNIFNLPSYRLIDSEYRGSYKNLTDAIIEEVTSSLRKNLNVGNAPLLNFTRILEREGIVITKVDLKSEKLDAVSTWFNDTPHIILNTFKGSCVRSRYDLAHELGHILLHRNVSSEEYEEDFHEIEGQAHYFASSLLLPEEGFLNDFWAATLKCFEGMKPKWKVSIQAMIRRALDLEVITHSQYSNLNIAISRKGWRRTEPYDDVFQMESTRLFSKCLAKMEESSTRSEELDSLCLPSDLLEEVCELPEDYFTDNSIEELDNVIEFRQP